MITAHQQEILIAAARGVMPNACALFSGFRVGAALMTAEGNIYTGINVESSSYGGTICAERTALVKALSEGERVFTAIAIATDAASPTMPCAICRQLLHDYAPDLLIISEAGGSIVEISLAELLPLAFTPDSLKIVR